MKKLYDKIESIVKEINTRRKIDELFNEVSNKLNKRIMVLDQYISNVNKNEKSRQSN